MKQRLYIDFEQVVYNAMVEFYRGFDQYANLTEKEIVEDVLLNAYMTDTEKQRELDEMAKKEGE